MYLQFVFRSKNNGSASIEFHLGNCIYAVISLGFTNPLFSLLFLNIYDFYAIWAAVMPFYLSWSYVCHAEVNAILNTNHASAVGQVNTLSLSLSVCCVCAFLSWQACACFVSANLLHFSPQGALKQKPRLYVSQSYFAYLLQLILLLQHVLEYIVVWSVLN